MATKHYAATIRVGVNQNQRPDDLNLADQIDAIFEAVKFARSDTEPNYRVAEAVEIIRGNPGSQLYASEFAISVPVEWEE